MDNHLIFRIVLIVLAAFILFALVNHYNSKQKQTQTEKFYDDVKKGAMVPANSTTPLAPYKPVEPIAGTNNALPTFDPASMKSDNGLGVKPSDDDNETYKAVDFNSQQLPNDCFPRDKLTAEDLLPHDAADSTWSQVNPAGQGDVGGTNFLTAGYHVGINTVGGSMRNANLQIRSEPPNPQLVVSPWLNSTINADLRGSYGNKNTSLEIGGACDEL